MNISRVSIRGNLIVQDDKVYIMNSLTKKKALVVIDEEQMFNIMGELSYPPYERDKAEIKIFSMNKAP